MPKPPSVREVAPQRSINICIKTPDAVTEGVETDVVQKWEESPSVTRILHCLQIFTAISRATSLAEGGFGK